MDLCVVARSARDRWLLVEALGLRPEQALDPPSARARLVHPTGTCRELLLVIREDDDVHWLRRVRTALGADRCPAVHALVAAGRSHDTVRRAGADSVVEWDGESRPVIPRVEVLVDLDAVATDRGAGTHGRSDGTVVVLPGATDGTPGPSGGQRLSSSRP